jgi:multisubunit Na+/H+ antiporter MnhC subunit
MNTILMLAALAEAGTGVILLVYPSVVRLLFGAEVVGTGVIMSRLAGIALRIGGRLLAGRRHSAGISRHADL